MKKYYELLIADGSFTWSRNEAGIEREEQLDGIYVIRTSEGAKDLAAAECVRTYKQPWPSWRERFAA